MILLKNISKIFLKNILFWHLGRPYQLLFSSLCSKMSKNTYVFINPQIPSLCTVTTTTSTSHISCILESTPCGELCTVTAPCSCPVFTCDYLFCFWMCLIEVFVLFMSIIPSKLLSYLLPTLTINTLSIVQSAAKSEHNAAWEVLAAVLQCCRVLSGQVEVVEWKQVSAAK